jgi:hypothetical protein
MDLRDFAAIRSCLDRKLQNFRVLQNGLSVFGLPCDLFDRQCRKALRHRNSFRGRLADRALAAVTPAEARRIELLYSELDMLISRMRLAFHLSQRLIQVDIGITRALRESGNRPRELSAANPDSNLQKQFVQHAADPLPLVDRCRQDLHEARQALAQGEVEAAERKLTDAQAFNKRELMLRKLLSRGALVAVTAAT